MPQPRQQILRKAGDIRSGDTLGDSYVEEVGPCPTEPANIHIKVAGRRMVDCYPREEWVEVS